MMKMLEKGSKHPPHIVKSQNDNLASKNKQNERIYLSVGSRLLAFGVRPSCDSVPVLVLSVIPSDTRNGLDVPKVAFSYQTNGLKCT